MPKYILALDQGTSSSRAILFDHDGAPVAQAAFEFPQIYPQPGWVSHDPEAIWSSQLDAARKVLADAATAPDDIAAIGITNQRETTIVWDRATGRADQRRRRLAVPPHRRHLRGPARARARPGGARPHGPADRRLLLRHEGALAARQQRRRHAAARRSRRTGVRHRRLVADPQAHRRAASTSSTRRTRRARCSTTCARAAGTTSCSTS